MTVDFDGPLASASGLPTSQWQVFMNNHEWTPNLINASGSQVQIQCSEGELVPGADRVTYFAPPYNLLGANGGPVEQFVGFPVLVS